MDHFERIDMIKRFLGLPDRRYEENPKCIVCLATPMLAPLRVLMRCGHQYCQPCLKRLIRIELRDRVNGLPNCCGQPLNEADVVWADIDSLEKFSMFKHEYDSDTLYYCSNPPCSALLDAGTEAIGVSEDGDGDGDGDQVQVRVCGKCCTVNCAECKGPYHPGSPCPQLDEMAPFNAVPGSEKWRRWSGANSTDDEPTDLALDDDEREPSDLALDDHEREPSGLSTDDDDDDDEPSHLALDDDDDEPSHLALDDDDDEPSHLALDDEPTNPS
ncbi:hypothetical protein Hte_009085 [Hypoxylon texense]